MYKVTYDQKDIVLRFERDLIDDETISKFLGHISLQSLLKNSTSSSAGGTLCSKIRSSSFPSNVNLLREPELNKGTAFTHEERE